MELINNNKCFVCGKENQYGLRLDFIFDGKRIKAEFVLEEKFQGFKEIIHGGIIATLLDEAMVNLAYRLRLNAVSANLNVNFRKPARPNERLILNGFVRKVIGRKVYAKAEIMNMNNEIIADGVGLLIKLKN